MEACLSAKEDRESSFHDCGGTVRLEKACLCAGNTSQIRFNLLGCAVMHAEVPEKVEKVVFTRCGGTVRLVQACLCAGKT